MFKSCQVPRFSSEPRMKKMALLLKKEQNVAVMGHKDEYIKTHDVGGLSGDFREGCAQPRL